MVKKGTSKSIKKIAKKSVQRAGASKTAKAAKKTVSSKTKTPTMKKGSKTVAKSKAKPKAAKKVAAPKAKAKKATTPVWKKKVSGDNCFYTFDQQELVSILDLVKKLDAMEDHVFHHHVSFHNNDFANWIEDVYDLNDLADEMRIIHDKHETQLLILRYIVNKL